MPQATFTFPKGFLWGAATASHQVEGNNKNNNWAYWEEQPGRIINGDKAGLACDWWGGRWKDDFDRAAEGGMNAHRLSVEWSRIQPEPDRWNEDALDVYREMLRGAVNRGLNPMVTLHHFSDPLWLFERGGWENDETPALFEAFTRRVVEALKGFCTTWIPINEPNVYTSDGYVRGLFPPGKKDLGAAFHVLANLLRGHALAYRAIKQIQREARVGTSLNIRWMLPAASWSPADKFLARVVSQSFNASFPDTLATGRFSFAGKRTRIPEAVGTHDFFGVNYYTAEQISFAPLRTNDLFQRRFFAPEDELSSTGFLAHRPQELWQVLKWAKGYNVPIIITENGVDDADDRLRPRYIVEHLHVLWKAIQFNWPIKGYIHWSLVDNFEWERGWTQRFGLWGLDVPTQTRIRRRSADLYAAICKENAISYQTVDKYAPQSLSALFPG